RRRRPYHRLSGSRPPRDGGQGPAAALNELFRYLRIANDFRARWRRSGRRSHTTPCAAPCERDICLVDEPAIRGLPATRDQRISARRPAPRSALPEGSGTRTTNVFNETSAVTAPESNSRLRVAFGSAG